MLRIMRAVTGGDLLITGELLLFKGIVTEKPIEGYVEDVGVYNNSGEYLFCGKLHVDVVRKLCGDESIPLLYGWKKIGLDVWMLTGGNTTTYDEFGPSNCLHLKNE